jgi:hypothetical protein
MDAALLDKILAASPWAAPIIAGIFLLRKEIGAVLMQSAEAGVPKVFVDMSGHLSEQADTLKEIKGTAVSMAEYLDKLVDLQRDIKEEIIRLGRSK